MDLRNSKDRHKIWKALKFPAITAAIIYILIFFALQKNWVMWSLTQTVALQLICPYAGYLAVKKHKLDSSDASLMGVLLGFIQIIIIPIAIIQLLIIPSDFIALWDVIGISIYGIIIFSVVGSILGLSGGLIAEGGTKKIEGIILFLIPTAIWVYFFIIVIF